MRLAFSNLAWMPEDDRAVYRLMMQYGFEALEFIPTRMFGSTPYDKISEAKRWAAMLREEYGMGLASVQSIWYGRSENIFGSGAERKALLDYTKRAMEFARAVDCSNLVLGCPRNRQRPEGCPGEVAVEFFASLGRAAAGFGVVIAVEAVSERYRTNFVNRTREAFDLASTMDSEWIKVNLDLGNMLDYGDPPESIAGRTSSIHHVHVSEPGLDVVRRRPEFHGKIFRTLRNEGYEGYVSVEMQGSRRVSDVESTMAYLRDAQNEMNRKG